MKGYIDIRSARKRNNKIGAKVAITGYGNGATFYAVRQTSSDESFKSIIHSYDQKTKQWVLTPDLDDELVAVISTVFNDFLKDAWNLFNRKMTDDRGEYFIMYRDSFVDNTDRSLGDKLWDIKLGESFVIAECNDYGDIVKYKRRVFGQPNSSFEEFTPTKYEEERIYKTCMAGMKIREARRDFDFYQRYARVVGNGMKDLTHSQRAYVRSERRSRQ